MNKKLNFAIHGKCNIEIDNNIIVLHAEGPWNMEFFQQLHLDLIQASKQVIHAPYAILLQPIGEAIPVNEVIDFHINFIKQGKATAVAVNLEYCHSSFMTQQMCERVYSTAGIKHAFFNSRASALSWLKQQLALT